MFIKQKRNYLDKINQIVNEYSIEIEKNLENIKNNIQIDKYFKGNSNDIRLISCEINSNVEDLFMAKEKVLALETKLFEIGDSVQNPAKPKVIPFKFNPQNKANTNLETMFLGKGPKLIKFKKEDE